MKIFLSLLLAFSLTASASSLKTLYSSLDPLSISQHLAFYELYSDTEEGKLALAHAWELLTDGKVKHIASDLNLPPLNLQAIISLITRQSFDSPIPLSENQLALVENISASLGNRQLKGSKIWSKEELLALKVEEIDLGRGILIEQFGASQEEIRQYEASLDLMALQILSRLPKNASPEEKIREINRFVFQEMQFRFPPHSLHAKEIDLYTFLPSVLDSRQGVCLGVSILYLCLAQRLHLALEIITPPGHIYVRYRKGDKILNIETTARGIHLPSETYLGINTRKLEMRTIKEVIGMAFINQASVFWAKEDYATTLSLYEKAVPYLPDDPLLTMFLGFNYLFAGKNKEGKALLEKVRQLTLEDAVSPETIPQDYLSGKVDSEGIKVVFLPVDETRASILEKQQKLQALLKRYPTFRAGLLQLAVTWLQLAREQEALEVLQRYHKIDPHDATVEYYLAILSLERFDYLRAWDFLKRTEALVQARDHHPKTLKQLRHALKRVCPEPIF